MDTAPPIPKPPATARSAIAIRDLRVDYGDFTAVRDLSLDVPEGEVFGLVGPNGAGKTSTFRVLATLLRPTYGEVALYGIDILEQAREARQIIGYMPDLAPVPSDLRVWEFLDFYASAYGHFPDRRRRRGRIDETLAEIELAKHRNARCASLSRGQMQRLVLGKVLLQRPRVLILDEPASGLDPLARRNLKHTLRRIAANGATVFISSHILGELTDMCSSLCIMNQGELLAQGTADAIREELGSAERSLAFRFAGGDAEAAAWLESRPQVLDVHNDGRRTICNFSGGDEEQAELVAELVRAGFAVRTVEETHNTFEEILTRIAEGNS